MSSGLEVGVQHVHPVCIAKQLNKLNMWHTYHYNLWLSYTCFF